MKYRIKPIFIEGDKKFSVQVKKRFRYKTIQDFPSFQGAADLVRHLSGNYFIEEASKQAQRLPSDIPVESPLLSIPVYKIKELLDIWEQPGNLTKITNLINDLKMWFKNNNL